MAHTKHTLGAPRSTSKWRDEWIVMAYELAREGATDNKIRNVLGIKQGSWERYLQRQPALVAALDRAREQYIAGTRREAFAEYVYRRLDPRLQSLWDDIESIQDDKNAGELVDAMLEGEGTPVRQHLFLHAFAIHNFNASRACTALGLAYSTFKRWAKTDPDFNTLLQEMADHRDNFIEGKLFDLIDDGEVAAVLFAAKTQLGHRGYNPGKSVTVNKNFTKDVNVKVSIDALGLPLATRQQILQQMIQARQGQPRIIDATATQIPDDEDDE